MKMSRELKEIERLRGVISNLQEVIKLLTFDSVLNNRKNNDLKKKSQMRRNNMQRARKELALMKRKNDFSNINMVMAMLNTGADDEE